MIKNIIFDIGFVLIQFDFVPFIESRYDKQTCEVIKKAVWGNNHWKEFDRGILTTEEVIDGFVSEAPDYEDIIRETMADFGECMSQREFVKPLIKKLKSEGYKLYYLSNWSDFLMNAKPEVMDFLPMLDGGVFSNKVHLLKPERAIYELICEKYGLIPSECIFIDDLSTNIEAANEYGIHGVLYEGYELTIENMNRIIAENK